MKARIPADRVGIYAVGHIVEGELAWIFREQPIADWGIDAQIETVRGGEPTGRLIAAQIKSGQSWFKERRDEGITFRGTKRHLAHWRGHSLPVVIILYDPTSGGAYWEQVRDDLVTPTGSGWRIMIPWKQRLGKCSVENLRAIALPSERTKFDYLAGLINGFATQSFLGFSRLPAITASLFAARKEIWVMSPFMEAGFLKMLATVSDSVSVRVAASEVHGLTDEDIRQLCRAHGKLVLRRARHLHAKLVVLDSELLITGSANITLGSLDRPIEVLQATSDAGVVERGIDEFRRLWGAI